MKNQPYAREFDRQESNQRTEGLLTPLLRTSFDTKTVEDHRTLSYHYVFKNEEKIQGALLFNARAIVTNGHLGWFLGEEDNRIIETNVVPMA